MDPRLNTQQNEIDKQRGYVVASRTNAAFYVDGEDHLFHVVSRLSNPEGAYRERELDSDKPGRSFSGVGGAHHGFDGGFHRHEETAKKFSKEVSEKIEYLQKEHGWQELVLVAEPHFLGLLKSALKPQVRKILAKEVPRELTHETPKELRNHILKLMKIEVNPLNKIPAVKPRKQKRSEC